MTQSIIKYSLFYSVKTSSWIQFRIDVKMKHQHLIEYQNWTSFTNMCGIHPPPIEIPITYVIDRRSLKMFSYIELCSYTYYEYFIQNCWKWMNSDSHFMVTPGGGAADYCVLQKMNFWFNKTQRLLPYLAQKIMKKTCDQNT